jgi:hypothetical protein
MTVSCARLVPRENHRRNFRLAKDKARQACQAHPLQNSGERKFMDYLVVLATMTMIVLYALIVARSLPKT